MNYQEYINDHEQDFANAGLFSVELVKVVFDSQGYPKLILRAENDFGLFEGAWYDGESVNDIQWEEVHYG